MQPETPLRLQRRRTRDLPILFSGPMVRALLDGRKTETRRVIKPQPAAYTPMAIDIRPPERDDETGEWDQWKTEWEWQGGPYPEPMREIWRPLKLRHAPGDLLWVREAISTEGFAEGECLYRATVGEDTDYSPEEIAQIRWRPSIYMPRWASRITLLVRNVRVERLQEITEVGARAEGATRSLDIPPDGALGNVCFTLRAGFSDLWNSLHARDGFSWDANPWVTVTQFEVIRGNIDEVRRAQQPEVPA